MVDSIATMAKRQGYTTLVFLGTQWTMPEDFYTGRIEAQGIKILVPDEAKCFEVDQITWDGLTQENYTDASRTRYIEIMNDPKAGGAEAVTLTCTEICLLVPPETAPLPAIGSVDVHVATIVEWIEAEEPATL